MEDIFEGREARICRREARTEGARLICNLALDAFAALRINLLVDRLNERSIAVAQRLGFRLEGTLHNERLNSVGKPQDTLAFGLTADR